MREKPILFNTEMVKAILDGRKTQTRRVVKPQPEYDIVQTNDSPPRFFDGDFMDHVINNYVKCPYGQPGDELWVRETFTFDIGEMPPIDQNGNPDLKEVIIYKATDHDPACYDGKWIPSIFMPREKSRIQLKVKDIRVERVQDISEDDIKAEGLSMHLMDICVVFSEKHNGTYGLREKWIELWNSINFDRGFGWTLNPWVWVVEFEVKK